MLTAAAMNRYMDKRSHIHPSRNNMPKPYSIAPHIRHILLKLLSSPEIKSMGQQLRISNHLDLISDSLWAIHAIMLDANVRSFAKSEPDLRKWLQDVNSAIMDVQNILEVIQDFYQPPKKQRHKVTTRTSSNLPLLDGSMSTSIFSICSHRRTMLVDLKQIVQSLNCLISRSAAFGLRIDMLDSMDPNQAEYFSIMRKEVVGRDDDVNKILQIIFQLQQGQSSWSGDESFVVYIVGSKKVGKTTLARMVYHHPLVCQVFEHPIWVDVPNYPYLFSDSSGLIIQFVRRITRMMSSTIAQKRFLLILDGIDVIWKRNEDALKELMKHLLCLGAPGSRVILNASYLEGCYEKTYKLENISQDVWTKIFLRYVVPTTLDDQAKQNSDLTNLANRTYYMSYSSFRDPTSVKGWSTILRHITTRSFSEIHDHYYLQHSHWMKMHYISHEEAQIFLYGELFLPLPLCSRQGCFDMMVAEGIFDYTRTSQQEIQQQIFDFGYKEIYGNRKDIYHFGKMDIREFRVPQQCRYLCILVDSDTSTCLNNLPVRIANNLRMLMLYKVKEEMCLQREASSIEIPESLGTNLVILSIINTGVQQLPNRLSMMLRLRHLNISEKEMEELPQSIFDLHNLRVLDLSHCEKLLQLPEKIHKLSKLLILKLSYCTRLQKISKSICNLENLQVLDIEGCCWLKELPEDLRYLERLISLNMVGCSSLTRIPLGISELTNLELLSGYMVDGYDNPSFPLKELQSLTSIKLLHLRHLECVLNLNDIITSLNLKEKRYLENLVLHWEWWKMDDRVHDQIQSLNVLDNFQPNASVLESLEIISYFAMQFPNWMMMDEHLIRFKFMRKIRLINLKRCENLPSLGVLPALGILEMSGLDSLTCVSNDDVHRFRRLESLLTLSEMPNLVEWNVRCNDLTTLKLIHCPKLIRLSGFYVFHKLIIWLQSKILGQCSTYFHTIFKYIKELEIVGCPKLRLLPEDIMHHTYLRILSIIRCNKLLSLPDWLQKLPRLEEITVSGCTTLSYVSGELKQQLKDRIIIQGCPKLQGPTR